VARSGYRTTRRADSDIIEIYSRGAEDFGVAQAERYHQRLIETFEVLARNPRMAPERREFRPAIRLHPCGAHLIFYTIGDDAILILRVLHNRQNWIRHLL
jgi:toxin ParE1/3/4